MIVAAFAGARIERVDAGVDEQEEANRHEPGTEWHVGHVFAQQTHVASLRNRLSANAYWRDGRAHIISYRARRRNAITPNAPCAIPEPALPGQEPCSKHASRRW